MNNYNGASAPSKCNDCHFQTHINHKQINVQEARPMLKIQEPLVEKHFFFPVGY